MSINQVTLTGNVTRDPDFRRTATDAAVLSFSIAVNDRRKNGSSGQWENVANYVDCVLFGNRADSLKAYIVKGAKLGIVGKLRRNCWEDAGKKRSKLDVVVTDVELLSHRQKNDDSQADFDCGKNVSNSVSEFSTSENASIYDHDILF